MRAKDGANQVGGQERYKSRSNGVMTSKENHNSRRLQEERAIDHAGGFNHFRLEIHNQTIQFLGSRNF